MSTAKKAPKMLILELIDRRPSTYFLDGGDPDSLDMPANISAPIARRIKSTSAINEVDAEGMTRLKRIRYIAGCDEIEVDRQVAMGVVPNPSQDVIWINNGVLVVYETGRDIGKYRYLKAFEGNVDNPNRPDGANDVFRELNPEKDSQDVETVLDLEAQAMSYLQELKEKSVKGSVVYNEDSIGFLASLFNLPPYDSGFTSEAWVALVRQAKANPEAFLNTIASKKAIVESDVNKAIATGVITLDEQKAVFTASNKIVTKLTGRSKAEKVSAVIDFMSNPKNATYYDQLRAELHVKMKAAVEVIS